MLNVVLPLRWLQTTALLRWGALAGRGIPLWRTPWGVLQWRVGRGLQGGVGAGGSRHSLSAAGVHPCGERDRFSRRHRVSSMNLLPIHYQFCVVCSEPYCITYFLPAWHTHHTHTHTLTHTTHTHTHTHTHTLVAWFGCPPWAAKKECHVWVPALKELHLLP